MYHSHQSCKAKEVHTEVFCWRLVLDFLFSLMVFRGRTATSRGLLLAFVSRESQTLVDDAITQNNDAHGFKQHSDTDI